MSLSDISDLTDISSDEDVPLARRSSKATKGSKEYKISHILRAPRTVQYTAKSLYDQIIENSIDLDPEYQRDVVWQEEKQSGLIDSILRNYYIPPIIFAVTVQDDGSELRTCIDGKQRLTSIQRFIDGQIPHKDSFTSEKLWYKSGATSAKRKLLPQHLRTQFAHKQVVCVEYTGLTNDQEREIFQRVQLGVALTPAERLQALVGPWSTTIHETQNQVLGEEGFEGYLDWGHARGRDFQCLATIGYLIENHPKTAIPGIKTLEKWLQKPQSVSNQLRADLHETFRVFVTLARDKKYSGSLNRPTRVSPIEFVMIGVLIYLKRQTLSLTQLSSAIEKMRKDVRASHQDIRSNTRVTKHLVEFMQKKIKVAELRSDGEGDQPAAVVMARVAKTSKRKRFAHSDDSDTEVTSRVKSAKSVSSPMPAAMPSNQASNTSGQKTKNTKMATVAPIPKTNPTVQPLQLTTSRRTTNNSLSNVYSVPTPNSSRPASGTQSSRDRVPPSSTSNRYNAPLESTTANTARHSPLTVQTSSTVKVESPQTGSLNSPAVLSAVDRLAPIRAAKASLASSIGVPSPPMNNANGTGTISSLVANPPKIASDPPQNSAVSQIAASLQQSMPPPSAQSLSQPLPSNREQGHPTPTQIEGALQALHLRIPRHGAPAQGMNTNTANPASVGRNAQSNGMTSHPTVPPSMPPSMPGLMNTSNANNLAHTFQGNGVGAPYRTYNGNMGLQPIPNQAFGLPMAPPWPSPSLGMPGNVPPQLPIMNFPPPIPTGPHALPQRPTGVARPPSNSMRAEPLGPPSRSTSSESTTMDPRQGSYNKDRHRPDSRWSHRQDPSQDYSRDKRNWYHSRS